MRGVRYFDALFRIEGEIEHLAPDERKKIRNERAKPILDELHDWVFRLNAAPKSLLGKAAHYTREQWPWMIRYLEDGRLEISNNRAERSIKPFVMSRKNFLFAFREKLKSLRTDFFVINSVTIILYVYIDSV